MGQTITWVLLGENFMGDIINNIEVTRAAANSFDDAAMDQKAELASMKTVDEEMANWWFGNAGDSFGNMSWLIENELQSLSAFTGNSHSTLNQQITRFQGDDTDVAASLMADPAATGTDG